MTDPLAPIESAPPHSIQEWSNVVGHQVIANNGPGKALCACGERQSDQRPAREWRTEHLTNAWPILMPRLANESILDWRDRIRVAIGESREAAEPEQARLMAAMSVEPGEPYPAMSDFDFTAEERAEVLEHQLAGRPFNRLHEPGFD